MANTMLTDSKIAFQGNGRSLTAFFFLVSLYNLPVSLHFILSTVSPPSLSFKSFSSINVFVDKLHVLLTYHQKAQAGSRRVKCSDQTVVDEKEFSGREQQDGSKVEEYTTVDAPEYPVVDGCFRQTPAVIEVQTDTQV